MLNRYQSGLDLQRDLTLWKPPTQRSKLNQSTRQIGLRPSQVDAWNELNWKKTDNNERYTCTPPKAFLVAASERQHKSSPFHLLLWFRCHCERSVYFFDFVVIASKWSSKCVLWWATPCTGPREGYHWRISMAIATSQRISQQSIKRPLEKDSKDTERGFSDTTAMVASFRILSEDFLKCHHDGLLIYLFSP